MKKVVNNRYSCVKGKSQTIVSSDMGLSIRTIIDRVNKGVPPSLRSVAFDSDNEIETFEKSDDFVHNVSDITELEK